MAVKTDNVTAGKVLSATVQYDNLNDAQRAYDIKGEAYISNKSVQNINNGYVNGTNGNQLASFSSYGDSNLSINFNTTTKDDVAAIADAIIVFIEDVRTSVDSKKTDKE